MYNPFTNPAHIQYVEEGGCDAIHRSKAWCNKDEGHEGEHWAPRIRGADLVWTDESSQNYPKSV